MITMWPKSAPPHFPPLPTIRPLALLALLSVLGACSFDYDKVLLTQEEKAEIPDTVLYNLSERVYEDGSKIIEFQSDVVKIFETRRIQEIEMLSFTQFDQDGEISVEGDATFASRDINNDDILLSGRVNIFITESESHISAEKFLFSPDQDLIWSPDDIEVELTRDDGTLLRGRGFVVDLLLQEVRFDRGGRGVITVEEEEESDAEETGSEAAGAEEEEEV